MNFLAGWMVMVGLIVLGEHMSDVAKAIEKHAQQCAAPTALQERRNEPTSD